jgi:hypothetical protein
MGALPAGRSYKRIGRPPKWRPGVAGHQRLRIRRTGECSYALDAELDGEIAIGFTDWDAAHAFLKRIQRQQRAMIFGRRR